MIVPAYIFNLHEDLCQMTVLKEIKQPARNCEWLSNPLRGQVNKCNKRDSTFDKVPLRPKTSLWCNRLTSQFTARFTFQA